MVSESMKTNLAFSLDGFSPYGANSNGSNSKRKADFSTPSAKTIKAERGGSPSEGKRTPAVDGSGYEAACIVIMTALTKF